MQEFYDSLDQNPDGRAYLKLIDRSKSQSLEAKKGHEIHHIHPKSLGGTDETDNLVRLSMYDHCLAHLWLAKVFPCPETYFVLNKLSGKRFERFTEVERITLEEVYQWSKVRSYLRDHLKGSRYSIYSEEGACRRVLKEEVDQWLSRGWKLGVPEKKKLANQEQNVGRVYIHNPDLKQNRMVHREDLQTYLDQGWKLGRYQSTTGEFKGRIPIHYPETDEEKHVWPEKLQSYLDRGWVRGNSKRSSSSRSRVMGGRVRISKGDEGKMVFSEELQTYLDQGWSLGRSESYKERVSGRIIIHKGSRIKRIPLDQFPEWEKDGWTRGIGPKHTKEINGNRRTTKTTAATRSNRDRAEAHQ